MSRPLGKLGADYSVVVVGSGYGGAIAASRLARCGQSVCVLERGREMHPGEYPDRLRDALTAVQVRAWRTSVGSRTALFDFRFNGDINVLVGCGLGGTSLINEGVTLEPEPRIFDDSWPTELRHPPEVLEPYYERVKQRLGSIQYPDDSPALAKLESLALSAAAMGEELERPPINVTFTTSQNWAGVEQDACILCGDCVTGCNHNAKNTVLMNYLPDAHRHGAQIFTQVEVRTVTATKGGRWRVDYRTVGTGQERFHAPTQFVVADLVVLAAGTLGTTEILLRSRAAGLSVSDALGEHFHANGDAFGVGFDGSDPVHAMGFGRRSASEHPPVGPNIAGMIDLREQPNVDDGLIIQEAAAPGALVSLLPSGLVAAAAAFGEGPRVSLPVRLRRLVREVFGVFLGPFRGPTDRTQLYMVMGSEEEDAAGRIILVADRAEVEWDGAADRPVYEREQVRLRQASEAIDATFIPDPLWKLPIAHSAITVHPLGGAVMADDAKQGVVNHKGQVFAGTAGHDFHKGLYVADGSVIPRSLVANPLLTISALAERTCDLLIEDRGWKPSPPPSDPPAPPSKAPGLRFTEAMRGWCSTRATASCEAGATQGEADGSVLELVLTVEFDDVERVLRAPASPGRVSGTVVAPELSRHRLTVTGGSIELFANDADRVETVCMRYELPLVSEKGRRYLLHGEKVLHRGAPWSALGAPWSAWRDSSTLFVRIDEDGDDDGAPKRAAGIVRLLPPDFARELTTFSVSLGCASPLLGSVARVRERARYLARYVDLFRKTLVPLYGGLLAEKNRFSPPPFPGPPARELELPDPEISWYDGHGWHRGEPEEKDPARLRLTRYQGGEKGPVMLAPGFGMTSDYLASATIKKNLAEYLFDEKYDVWLFDYRACTELHSAVTDSTLDAIALEDWPEGVAEVRRHTKGARVQVVGHCIGATTFLMSMLAGRLDGVRSAVCSQASIYASTSLLNRLKARLHIPALLQLLRIDNVSPNNTKNWRNKLLDVVLSPVPVPRGERCGLAMCRWINAIYGLTHCHAQLNDATHRDLYLMFGPANVNAFKQIALIMKKGHMVDHEGNDIYREAYGNHPERLKLPLHFLVGKRNDIFHPDGTARTLDFLKAHNDPTLYTETVFDDYGHLDCFVGKNAADEVFPTILEHLDRHAVTPTSVADPAP